MTEITEQLLGVFRTVFENETLELTADTTADHVENWDSIAHISLIFAIEEEYSIRFSTKDLEEMQNVGDLQAAIVRHKTQ